tara:strand:- start:628 stop:933 length:306 start_codon:yes stop_codon:yes gene_type:complete
MGHYLADIQPDLQEGKIFRRAGWPQKGAKVNVAGEAKTATHTRSIQFVPGSQVKAQIVGENKPPVDVNHVDAFLLTSEFGEKTLGYTFEHEERISQDWVEV